MIIIVNQGELKLPQKIARKLQGKKVQIKETKDGILLQTLNDPIATARGILKGSSLSTEKYFKLKSKDKELER
jgi:hypothetical protein